MKTQLTVSSGRRIGRVKREVTIQSFDGEREMENLKVYPISMAPDKQYAQELEKLGEFYFQILRSGSAQMDYEGDCLDKKKRFVSRTALHLLDCN